MRILLLLALLCACGNGWGAVTKTVQTQGQGVVLRGDTATAFIEAKNHALRQAVEQAVGVLVSARSRVANFTLLEDDIYSRTAGFVRRYDIIERKRLDENTYGVELRAEVDLGGLESRLQHSGQMAQEIGSPRLYCLGDSALAHGVVPRLQKALAGVEVQTALPGDTHAEGVRGDIVIELGHDASMLPSAPLPFSRNGLDDVGLHSVESSSRLTAYWRDSGKPIAQYQRIDVAVGPSPASAKQQALGAAADSLVLRLHQELASAWRTILYDGREIALIVRGKPAALQQFEQTFSQGMASIRRLEPQRIEQEKAAYKALSRGTAFAVARELSAKGLDGYDVEIVAVTANTLQVNLAATAQPALGLRP